MCQYRVVFVLKEDIGFEEAEKFADSVANAASNVIPNYIDATVVEPIEAENEASELP